MAAEQFNFRVETELKKAFLEKARENGTTASELLVGFMESYLGIESKKPMLVVSSKIDAHLSELEERLVARIAALEGIVKLQEESNLALLEQLERRLILLENPETKFAFLGKRSP